MHVPLSTGEVVICSDLERLDQIRDEDIDTEDAPTPDLADWVRYARPFVAPEDDCGS